MASSVFRTIVTGWPDHTGPKLKEALMDAASGTILPGHLIDFNAGGSVIPHGASGSTVPVQKMVAVEDPYVDAGTVGVIDTPYTVGELVRYIVPERGSTLYMILASGQNLIKGAAVTAAANGQITGVTSAATVHEEAIFGYLAED